MLSKAVMIGWTVFVGWSFLSGMAALSEQPGGPDSAVNVLAVAFSVFFHFGLWCLVGVPTYFLSRMFSRKGEV